MKQLFWWLIILLLLCGGIVTRVQSYATTTMPYHYDIGTPILQSIYVNPTSGSDTNSGAMPSLAKRTVTAAWQSIPSGTTLTTTGYQIILMPGTYDASVLPNYWENRHGTAQFPIIITSQNGRDSVTLTHDLNIANVDYLYITDMTIAPNSDVVHCERCMHFLLRNTILDGGAKQAHETLKINQSQYIYLENNDIHGADDNAVDFVAVQYGHILDNTIHNANDWCLYTKGGSAYLRIEGNTIYDCGTGGYTAGQGTGFEYMTSPWIQYEAYDIKFVNNIIHHTTGAGMGVNGGYNILLAYNTLYHVGTQSHGIEVVFGLRSCDGDSNAATSCSANLARGGWGTTVLHTDGEPIPNRNVFIYNNLLYNPPGVQSQWQHFSIAGPRTPAAGSNIANPSRTDTNLQIKGNIIWNGSADLSLGLGNEQGCLDSNPTCNEAQLWADNRINTLEPQLTNPGNGNFRPLIGGNLTSLVGVSIPDFPSGDLPAIPGADSGNVDNSVIRDYANSTRQGGIPGAYASASAGATVTPRSVTSTSTSTPRASLTMSRTRTATRSSTPTRTNSVTSTVTNTRTASRTYTPSNTRTNTRTATTTRTPTNSRTATSTWTASRTFTASNTRTTTRTATRTATASTTLTPSYTRTPTSSRTATRTVSASSTRTATPTVTISVTAGAVTAMPVIPVIDAAAKSRLRQIFLTGQTLGNRATVFAKAGDSITASWSFLVDIGCGGENVAAYSGLATTITYFRSTALGAPSTYGSGWCDVSNSFNAYSVSADSGWSADYALAVLNPLPSGCTAPHNTAFLCELKRKKPSIVLIMYGTNDVERYNNTATFTTQLTTMVQQSVAAGVIPVLSTIPPRVGYSSRVLAYNTAIIAVAQAQQVPLWNYWLTFQGGDMVNGGLDGDGVHPNIYMGDQGANFDTTALRYGYNQRNLTAVQVLDVLRRVVILDGVVDP